MARGLSLLTAVALARVLGRHDFGQLGMIEATAGMYGVFAGLGLGVTVTKHMAELRMSQPQRAGQIARLAIRAAALGGLIMAVGLGLTGRPVATHFLAAPSLAGPLQIVAWTLPFDALSGAQAGVLAGVEAFGPLAIVNVGSGLTSLVLVGAGAYFGGVEGAAWGLVLSAVAGSVLSHRAMRAATSTAGILLHAGEWRREVRLLWSFGLPAALAAAMVGPVNWACAALLSNQPNGYEELGIWNAVNVWFVAVVHFPSLLGQTALPMLSERLGLRDSKGHDEVVRFIFKSNLKFIVATLAVLGIASPWIMRSYGRGFSGAWPVLEVSLLAAAVLAAQAPVGQVLIASGRIWAGVALNASWALTVMTASALLVARGALGLALARLAAYSLLGVVSLIILRRVRSQTRWSGP